MANHMNEERTNLFGFDAFSPREIAEKVENIGVGKARLPLLSMIMLGILAGAFIALGAMFFVTITSDANLSFGWSRILGGIAFSMGLIMVTIAGAELFTGNNLIAMAWADKKISTREVLKNWAVVSLTNFMGALLIAFLLFMARHQDMNNGAVGELYLQIAQAKCAISFEKALFSGILCNILVCLAVWMAQAGRSVWDKIIVIIFPVAAFVSAGFEHSIANMFYIPMGIFIQNEQADAGNLISWIGLLKNLIPVISGNLIGGSLFVALIYYVIYRRKTES
jgi:formate transporter